MASAGSKPAEYNIIASLFDEGDEVIIPTPAWVSFVAMVQLSGAEPKLVACPESGGFLLDPERLRSAITPAHPRHHAEFALQSDRRGLQRGATRRARTRCWWSTPRCG